MESFIARMQTLDCKDGINDMISDELKKLKESRNMTVQDISKKSGVPASTVSRILSGQTETPYFSNIVDMVIAMEGSVDEIIGIKSASTPTNNPLLELYERDLVHERMINRRLRILLSAIIIVLLLVVTVDALNGNIGYIRY